MSEPVGVGVMSHDDRSHGGRLCCKQITLTVTVASSKVTVCYGEG